MYYAKFATVFCVKFALHMMTVGASTVSDDPAAGAAAAAAAAAQVGGQQCDEQREGAGGGWWPLPLRLLCSDRQHPVFTLTQYLGSSAQDTYNGLVSAAACVLICAALLWHGVAHKQCRSAQNVQQSAHSDWDDTPRADDEPLLREPSARPALLQASLEGAIPLLTVVRRGQRKDLLARMDALLDALEASMMLSPPPPSAALARCCWVVDEWSRQQAVSVSEAMAALERLHSMGPANVQAEAVTSAVMALICALEEIESSHVSRMDAMAALLQAGGMESAALLEQVMHRALDVLDTLSVALSTPRKDRKVVLLLGERVEAVLDGLDDRMLAQLSLFEGGSDSSQLCQTLCAVDRLEPQTSGCEAIQIVEAMLDMLRQASDPVATVCLLLSRAKASSREQGLQLLSTLPRQRLENSSEAEVSAMGCLWSILVADDRSCEERRLAMLSMFACGIRNGSAMLDVTTEEILMHFSQKWDGLTISENRMDLRDGLRMELREGLQLCSCKHLIWHGFAEVMCKNVEPARSRAERVLAFLLNPTSSTRAAGLQCRQLHRIDEVKSLITASIKLMRSSADEVASVALADWLSRDAFIRSLVKDVHDQLLSEEHMHVLAELLDAVHAVYQSVGLLQPVSWWTAPERCERENVETAFVNSALSFFYYFSAHLELPMALASSWEPFFREAVHIVKVNQQAGLPLRDVSPQGCVVFSTAIISAAASDNSGSELVRTSMSKQPEAIKALLYATVHPFNVLGASSASFAAIAAADLIGRNEQGLTLTAEAVSAVISNFARYFDPADRRSTYSVRRMRKEARSVAALIISDANKPHVLEHKGAVDALVSGLLLDDQDPRSNEEGADGMQEICVSMLQNLALYTPGMEALRVHAGAMQALRTVGESGRTAASRQCAAGALFELEGSHHSGSSVVTEGVQRGSRQHVMISYSWNHQTVIKRVHKGLLDRGYSTWIDFEQMQGSTVEQMAAAVEDAAVLVYAVCRAYKESVRCPPPSSHKWHESDD
jgi:hypothetical protein